MSIIVVLVFENEPIDEMPLKLFKVVEVSHERSLKCIKTEEGFKVPIEYTSMEL